MNSTTNSSATSILKRVPLFAGLSEEEFTFLTARVVQRRFSAGELVFAEAEPCAGLYVIEAGNVRIFKSSAGGREQVLAIDGPGSSIAELPVFDGGNYPASAQAITDCSLLFVSKKDFQALCLQHPEVALKVLRVVGARLRRLVGIIEELSFATVWQPCWCGWRNQRASGKRMGSASLCRPITMNWRRRSGPCANWCRGI